MPILIVLIAVFLGVFYLFRVMRHVPIKNIIKLFRSSLRFKFRIIICIIQPVKEPRREGQGQLNFLQQIQFFVHKMRESMVDFVLERGNHKSGEGEGKNNPDPTSSVLNRRKLLAHLFKDIEASEGKSQAKRSISDLKYEQISGQLNYFSGKLHGELAKKHLALDNDLTTLENEWMRKKIPDFYSYYFLKFAYANTYTRMHELFLSEIEHMSREKDSYLVVKKTIQARQICIANLKRQLSSFSDLDMQESLDILRKQLAIKKQKMKENEGKKKKNKNEEVGKSWKNKLEIVFEIATHLRKLTAFVIQLIKNWKNSVYGISEDPRRFRQRVIFFFNEQNYLTKMVHDNKFITESVLKKYMTFGNHFDPFLLKPLMVLENMESITDNEQVLLGLLKPNEMEMQKMTKSLMVLAEEQYDQNQQSKMLEEGKNPGQLEQRKKFFQKRRDIMLDKHPSKVQKNQNQNKNDNENGNGMKNGNINGKTVKFSVQKNPSSATKLEESGKEKDEKDQNLSRINSSLNKARKIRSVDFKKISPYLSRNDKIAKAQKVVQLEHKFKVAQQEYVDTIKRKNDPKVQKQELKKQWSSPQQEVANNKIFNRYIEENMRLMDEANKKAFLYRNKVSPNKNQSVKQSMDYNQIGYKDRKQAEYERNLEQYQREQRTPSRDRRLSGYQSHKNLGSKAVIEISNKGVMNNRNTIENSKPARKIKGANPQQKAQQMKLIESKLRLTAQQKIKREQEDEELDKSRMTNLFQSEQRPEILVMRQQPQKIEEIKQYLYNKIKQQLLEEMKKSTVEKKDELHNLIEEQKIKRLNEIIQNRKLEEERQKEELIRMQLNQLQKQRKKQDFQIRVEPIQYAQENSNQFFDAIFQIFPQTYHRLFLNEKLEEKKEFLLDQLYLMFFKGYLDGEEVAYSIVRYDWECESSRKLVVEYVAVKQFYHFISNFHNVLQYLWQHDPVEHIELVILNNAENEEGAKFVEDLQEYADQRGQTFQKNLYSNVKEIKYVWTRPKEYKHLEFPYTNFYFGKSFSLKCELMTTALSMNQRSSPKIDMNLETFTNYVFLLEEVFRKYLTPEEVVELRESSTNIRRLKDIFRIILEMEKNNPIVDELTIVEGLNLDDLYEKLREKTKPPYDKYYWHHFYDRTLANRIILSIIEFKLQLEFPINSCYLEDRRFLRINPRRKVLMLRSSVYPQDNIYILNTDNPKIRMFMMGAEMYKTMRIQLFVFLNLVFNNVVEDTERYVNSFWFPQFVVTTDTGKEVKRVTDFSITMKKSFFLSEQIFFCNHEYIKNAISPLPKKSDVIYRDSVIVGFLHTGVESSSTGMPLYAKMIDKDTKY